MSASEEVAKPGLIDMAVQTLEQQARCHLLDKVQLKQNLGICLTTDEKGTVLLPALSATDGPDVTTQSQILESPNGPDVTRQSQILESPEAQLVADITALATVATNHKELHSVTSPVGTAQLVSNVITLKKNELKLQDRANMVPNVIINDHVTTVGSPTKELSFSVPTTTQTETVTTTEMDDTATEKSDSSEGLVRRHQCTNCSKTFTRRCDLQRHLRIHTGEKPYKCSHCSKAFSQSGSLSAHLRTHTGKKHECRYCQQPFPVHSELVQHVKQEHTGEAPFECKYCKKLFTSSGTLTIHIRVHTGEKPFSCHLCPKSFAYKSDRTKHIRSHTGEKPFECMVCHKFFSRSTSLTVHRRIHTGEMPFKCIYCMKTFSCSSYLTKHTRTHTGEKPYVCKHCDKSFRVSSHLARHIRGHSNLKGFDHKYCKRSNGCARAEVTTAATSISTSLISPVTVTVVSTPHSQHQQQCSKESDPSDQSDLISKPPPPQPPPPIEVSFSPHSTVAISNIQEIQSLPSLQSLEEATGVESIQTVQAVPSGVQVMEFQYARNETFNSAGVVSADNVVTHEDVSSYVFEDPNQAPMEVAYGYSSVFSLTNGDLMLATHGCSQCGKTFFNGSMYRVHLRSHQLKQVIPFTTEDDRFFHYNCCQKQHSIFDF